MLLLLFTLLSSPAQAGTAPDIQFTSLEQILRMDSGCVNPGGGCSPGGLPCCGQDTACFRGRCVVIEDTRSTELPRISR